MSEISRAVKDFVTSNISSLAELEALLLLYKKQGEAWTADSLSREMRSNPSYAEAMLEKLCAAGLVQRNSNQYVLAEISDERRKIIDELIVNYQLKRLSIIDLIYQTPTEKLRDIADAFKIRK